MRLTLAMLAAVLLTAQPAAAQLPSPLKIGVLNDQSGPFGDQSGRGSVIAAQLAAEDFMREAPGVRVEIVYGDHQNKPDIGSAIVRSWVDREGVAAVADVVNSSVGLAVDDVLRERHRAFIATNVGTSDLTGKFCAPTTVQWTFDTWAFGNSAARTLRDVGPFFSWASTTRWAPRWSGTRRRRWPAWAARSPARSGTCWARRTSPRTCSRRSRPGRRWSRSPPRASTSSTRPSRRPSSG